MSRWYYAVAGEQRGPVDDATLARLIADRQVQPDDLVWCESMANWQPMGSVPELQAMQRAAAMPAPLPPRPQAAYGAPGMPGQPYGPGQMPAQPLNYHGYPGGYLPPSERGRAVASLVCGIIGMFAICAWAVLGLIAILLAASALNGMSRHHNEDGKGMAIAGLILGIIDLLIGLLFFLGLIVG